MSTEREQSVLIKLRDAIVNDRKQEALEFLDVVELRAMRAAPASQPAPQRVELPPLPTPTYYVAEEAKSHGMHPCYRSVAAMEKRQVEGVYRYAFTAEQMFAYASAALASQRAQPEGKEA